MDMERTPEMRACRRRLIRHYRKMIRECEQMKVDKESWNDNRPEEQPFDVGWEIMMVDLHRKCLEKVLRWQRIPNALSKRIDELCGLA